MLGRPVAATPAQREQMILQNPELWAMNLTHLAWGWRNMDGWQRRILLSQSPQLHINCARQSGKSATLSVKVLHKALTMPKALILIVAEQRQANEDIIKCKDLLNTYQKSLKERYDGKLTIGVTADNKTSIELSNDARIIGLPATEKIRGFSAPTIVWIDEASWVDNSVYVGLKPMLMVGGGQLIESSTPNGPQGFFYEDSKNDNFEHIEVNWHDVPRYSKEQVEMDRLVLGEPYVQQEYECRFLDGVTSLFTDKGLRESMDDTQDVFNEEMDKMRQNFEAGVTFV